MNNKALIFGLIAGIIVSLIYFNQKKTKKPCPCLQGQDAIIGKLTEAELKDQIQAMDSTVIVDGKTTADLRNILTSLIAKNK